MNKLRSISKNMDTYMFVGSYTRKMPWSSGTGKGISIFSFDTNNGNLSHLKTLNETQTGPNPSSFLSIMKQIIFMLRMNYMINHL